jgi:hypothetical protein
MKTAALFAFAGVLSACVPASEKLPPAGAAGFLTEPSAAARGEPVPTADGWTVTFDKIILQATVNVRPAPGVDSVEDGGSTEAWLWNGKSPTRIFARALKVGPWTVVARLNGSYVSTETDTTFEDVVNVGVSAEDERRFRTFAQASYGAASHANSGQGPSLLVALHAEKEGRTIRMDVTFGGVSVQSSEDQPTLRHVRADAVDLGPLGVEPERLLMSSDGDSLDFEPIAAADANRDGWVSAAELGADFAFDELILRAGKVLVIR